MNQQTSHQLFMYKWHLGNLFYLLLFLSLFAWSCQDEEFEILHIESVATNTETVSLEEARSYFGQGENSNLYVSKSTNLRVIPDWNTFRQESLTSTKELLTSVSTSINRKGKFKSELFFVKVQGEMLFIPFT